MILGRNHQFKINKMQKCSILGQKYPKKRDKDIFRVKIWGKKWYHSKDLFKWNRMQVTEMQKV